MRRGVTSAEGNWPWTLHDQDGGHVQKEISSVRACLSCRLFTHLPPRRPGQQGS